MTFLYQIDGTKPDGWRKADAESAESLARTLAKRCAPGTHRVNVAEDSPTNLHRNGQPIKNQPFSFHIPEVA